MLLNKSPHPMVLNYEQLLLLLLFLRVLGVDWAQLVGSYPGAGVWLWPGSGLDRSGRNWDSAEHLGMVSPWGLGSLTSLFIRVLPWGGQYERTRRLRPWYPPSMNSVSLRRCHTPKSRKTKEPQAVA